jgi:hypothetical protein
MLISKPGAGERDRIEAILKKCGVFTKEEVICALELFDSYLENETRSGYHFL